MTTYADGWVESPNYYGGLIADLGRFRGEWPPYAPLSMPADADEIDLLVCLPNPDGNLEHLKDGSYPTDYVWCGRYYSIYTFGEYTVQASGGSSGRSTATPPGSHLYVIWYGRGFPPIGSAAQPSMTPKALVPQGMAVGTTAPARGSRVNGHWSTWQDYGTRAFPFRYDDYYDNGDVQGFLEAGKYDDQDHEHFSDWPNVKTILDAQQVATRAGSDLVAIPDLPYSQVNGAGFYSWADKNNRSGSYPGVNWHAGFHLAQACAFYRDTGHANDLDYDPPLMGSLTFGVDYLNSPETGLSVEYEGLATRIGWQDWDTSVTIWPTNLGYGQEFARVEFDAVTMPDYPRTYSDYNIGYRYAALTEAITFSPIRYAPRTYYYPRTPTSPSWFAYGDGLELTTYTAHSSVATPTYTDSITLPLSLLGDVESFTLLVQPDVLGSDPQPVVDFPCPPSADGHGVSDAYLSGQTAQTTGIDGYHASIAGPAVVYQQPRFRYWVPGPIPGPIPDPAPHVETPQVWTGLADLGPRRVNFW